MSTVNITPTPRILNVLAHTTMDPVDALCELIDNAIDSFEHAKGQGLDVGTPTVRVEIPSVKEISQRQGYIRVSDNGPGMTLTQVQKALCAGYSSNNSFDNLGLFGVGFNISTSKFGIRTRVATMRPGNQRYLCVNLDLQEINRTKCFEVPYEEKPQCALDEFFPSLCMHGTVVEVSHWWPEGDTNHAFALSLAKISDTQLRKTLGRRYSTLLQKKQVKLILNGHECVPFRHCVWRADRFVMKQGVKVPAVMQIDEEVGVVRKCERCGAEVGASHECPECHSLEIREVVQRVKGWIGVQRYEDKAKYGIDLIRNGRCICEAEKNAFFFFKNEDGILEKEYPQDNGGTNGRIIGELHFDFVPVGFTKEDFDRSSVEWHKAIACVRGETSLLPSRIPEGKNNSSPLFRLFQAYRRSDPGPTCLYMGVYDETKRGPTRISKDVIEDYLKRFEKNENGFGWDDDAEWYKHVENCLTPPASGLPCCPNCQMELPEGTVECPACGTILQGKTCTSCGEKIPVSAQQCPRCGAGQGAAQGGKETQGCDGFGNGLGGPSGGGDGQDAFWFCAVCHAKNPATENCCTQCHNHRGALNPLDEEYLRLHSDKKDELSRKDIAFLLPNGELTPKISFDVFFTQSKIEPYVPDKRCLKTLPFVEVRSANSIVLFVDPRDGLFARGELAIKEVVAEEVAQHVYEYSLKAQSQDDQALRLAVLVNIIKRTCWREDFELDKRSINEKISRIFRAVKEQLVENTSNEDDYFSDLDDDDKAETLRTLASNGVPADRYSSVCTSGEFLRYVPDRFVVQLFTNYPKDFFDKGVLKPSVSEDTVKLFGAEAVQSQHQLNVQQVLGYLQTLLTFSEMKQVANPDSDYVALVRLSANALIKKLAIHV